MNPTAVLLAGAVGTYVLRVMFISLVPAHQLPERLRHSLQMVGPAALAALVVTDICHATGHPTAIWPTIAAVLTAGTISALTKNLALTMIGGLLASLLVAVIS